MTLTPERPKTPELNERQMHHIVGTSYAPGTARGCAHSYTELKKYIDSGALPNPDCPAIYRWNAARTRGEMQE